MLRLLSGGSILVLAYIGYLWIGGERTSAWANAQQSVADPIVLPVYIERIPGFIKAELNAERVLIVTSTLAYESDAAAVDQICALAELKHIALTSVGIRDVNAPERLRHQSPCPSKSGS